MSLPLPELGAVLTTLRGEYPEVRAPKFTGPFEIVLYENVAYLVGDERRQAVWADFCRRVGTDPEAVLAADPELLLEVLRPGGMLVARRADKVLRCCSIVADEFDGDLDSVMQLPQKPRRKALGRFPGFGAPGVDKILLLTRTEKILALDSNGLRVLLRLGFGAESKNYATSYRSVQLAIAGLLPARFDAVIRGHFLLRKHGQEVCRHGRPLCDACALRTVCASASTGE